ncbi:hypothetical protein C7S17_5368 [Burkholderia thailandensis]|nr:hypothetical protein [Burkholderia thailandensis]
MHANAVSNGLRDEVPGMVIEWHSHPARMSSRTPPWPEGAFFLRLPAPAVSS